jgi:hypothetical protein
MNTKDVNFEAKKSMDTNVDSNLHSRPIISKDIDIDEEAPFTFAYVEKLLRKKNLSSYYYNSRR